MPGRQSEQKPSRPSKGNALTPGRQRKKRPPEGGLFDICSQACARQARDQKKWRMPNSAPDDLPPATVGPPAPGRVASVLSLLARRETVVYSAVRLDRLYWYVALSWSIDDEILGMKS